MYGGILLQWHNYLLPIYSICLPNLISYSIYRNNRIIIFEIILTQTYYCDEPTDFI